MKIKVYKQNTGGSMIRKSMSVLALISLFFIAGCGSSGSGSTSLFTTGTVTYSVTPVNSSFSSTVGTSPTTADTTSVTLSISNTPYANVIKASPYTIKNIVITYTKADDSKLVLTDYATSSPMSSGGSAAIPVIIATSTIKEVLLLKGFSTGASWNFYVNSTFTVVEDFTGNSSSYQVQLGSVQFK
jgi:hypothetical protein